MHEVDELIEKVARCERLGDKEDARQLITEHLAVPHKAVVVALAVADMRTKGLLQVDDHEGSIDIRDIMACQIEGAEGSLEWKVHEALMSGEAIPMFVVLQCVVVIGIWFIMMMADGWDSSGLAGLDSIFPGKTSLSIYHDCEDRRLELWRLLTYQYSHFGGMHVSLNVIMTLILGIPLEGLYGTRRMALFFNFGVFGGACCCLLSATRFPVVGMSGGCYSLIGMHSADLIMNWGQKQFRWATLFLLLYLGAFDVGIVYWYLGDEKISHAAHLGGYLAGICIAVVLGTNLVLLRHERVLQFISLLLGLGCTIFCLGWAAQWPPRDIWDQVPWCWARQVWNPDLFGVEKSWQCVRCDGQACIDKWSQQHFIRDVNTFLCEQIGWSVTER